MSDTIDRLKSALADRYTIEREIGAGGMATVYLAEDVKHRRTVAVKVLRPDLAAALGPERFLQEIEIAARLQHPNILALYDSGEADGFLFYVMPYIDGPSLRDKLAKEGELPVGDAVRILRDVVDALTEAHAHGVVHRDIKPENILLRGRHALVTDFGVAKAVSEATGREQLTTAGVALGTPAYMAPEQASADPHLDQRVDIYAVGAVAYELLTGRPVFLGTTPQMILSAHMTEPPTPITKHRDTVPPALESVVMRCLEKRPADRWQSVEELLSQLDALATPSGGVTPTQTVPVAGLTANGNRASWIVGALALVAVAIVTIVILKPLVENEETWQPVVPTQLTANPPELSVSGSAISPDGRYLAYADPRGLYLQNLETNEPRPIPIDDSISSWNVWWYPDNENLLVLGNDSTGIQSLWSVSMFGGAARKIHSGVFLAAVAPDGSAIAVIRGATTSAQSLREIWLMGLAGENPQVLATAEPDESFWKIAWTPDASAVAVAAWSPGATGEELDSESKIELIDVSSKERRTVLSEGRIFQSWHGALPFAWCGESKLVYSLRDGPWHQVTSNVWIADVDLDDARVIGEPRRLTQWQQRNVWNLSVTGDCSRIVVQQIRNQADVFVGELNRSGTAFVNTPRRVTSDEREDFPGAWLDDSSLVIVSSRSGGLGLFQERTGAEGLESLQQTDATWLFAAFSRRDNSILYQNDSDIWAVPPTGGAARLLAEGEYSYVKCASIPDGPCFVGAIEGTQFVFYQIDPVSGETLEMGRTEHREPFTEFDISPDGSKAAVVHNDDNRIVLVDLVTKEESYIVVDDYGMFEHISWTAQGDGFFVNPGTAWAGGYPKLVHVDMNGRTNRLIGSPSNWYLLQTASPDGRYLAFASMSFHGNAWLIEAF